jgi:GNAT superfamily N-acetyltransferase
VAGIGATIRTWPGEEARELAGVVCGLYEQVFREPPFNGTVEEFAGQRDYYPEMTWRQGYRLTTAQAGGEWVGFGYGYLLPSDSRWWERLDEPVTGEMAREDGHRTFALIDFGVLPAWQGKGIGHAVHDELLGGSGAERATLTVQPKARRTLEAYRRWGWSKVGHLTNDPSSLFPEFDVLLLAPLPRR